MNLWGIMSVNPTKLGLKMNRFFMNKGKVPLFENHVEIQKPNTNNPPADKVTA